MDHTQQRTENLQTFLGSHITETRKIKNLGSQTTETRNLTNIQWITHNKANGNAHSKGGPPTMSLNEQTDKIRRNAHTMLHNEETHAF